MKYVYYIVSVPVLLEVN